MSAAGRLTTRRCTAASWSCDNKTPGPFYLVYSPLDANSWTVASVIEQTEIGEFPTLYAALSFVRPVRIQHPVAALESNAECL